MAGELGKLTAIIGADIKQLKRNVDLAEKELVGYSNKTDKQLDKTDRRWKKHGTGVAASMNAMKASALGVVATLGAITFGIQRLTSASVETAASFEQMEVKLNKLTKGEGKKTLDELNQWALDMPVNTQKAVASFTLLKAMGLDPSIKTLQTLTDVASIFGEDTLTRLSLQLGQAAAKGKIMAQDLNIMAEAGINARGYLQDAFGMTLEEIQKSGIAIKDIIAVIFAGMERDFGGAAKDMMGSWMGLKTVTKSYWVEVQRAGMEKGAFDALKDSLVDVNTFLKENKESLAEIINIMGQVSAAAITMGTNLAEAWLPFGIMAGLTIKKMMELMSIVHLVEKDAPDFTSIMQGQAGKIKKEIKELQNFIKKGGGPLNFLTFAKDAAIASTKIKELKGQLEGIEGALEFEKVKKAVAELPVIGDDYSGILEEQAKQVKGLAELETARAKIIKEYTLETRTLLGIYTEEEQHIDKIKKSFQDLKDLAQRKYGIELNTSKAQAASIKNYKEALGVLERLKKVVDVVSRTPVIGDVYEIGELREAELFGKAALLEDTPDKIAPTALEDFAEDVGNSLASGIRVGVTDGLGAGLDAAIQSFATSIGLAVSDSITEAIGAGPMAEIMGPVAGAIAGSIVGAGVDALRGTSDKEERRRHDAAVKSLTENTDAIKRNTEFLRNESSSYTSSIFNITEALTRSREEAGLPAGITLPEIGERSDVLDEYEQVDFGNIANQAQEAGLSLDQYKAALELFAVKVDNLQKDIIGSAADLAQGFGDAFLTSFAVSEREFKKTGDDLTKALFETFTTEGSFTEVIRDFGIAAVDAVGGIETLTRFLGDADKSTQEYADGLKLLNKLTEAQTNQFAKYAQDAYGGTLGAMKDFKEAQRTSGFGVSDWQNEIFSITGAIGALNVNADDYYDKSGELFAKQFEAIKTLVSLAEQQLDAYKDAQKSIEQQIWELTGGDQAATTSAGAWDDRFATLLGEATTKSLTGEIDLTAVSEFQSFIPNWIDAMTAAGFGREQLTQQAISALANISAGLDVPIQDLEGIVTDTTANVNGEIGPQKEVHVHLYIDGKEIGYTISDQIDALNEPLIVSLQSVMEQG